MATVHEDRILKLGFSHSEDGETVKTTKKVSGIDVNATEAKMNIVAASINELTEDTLLSKEYQDDYVIEDDED